MSRARHRHLDLVVVAVLGRVAVLPFLNIDSALAVHDGGGGLVLGFVWWGTNFASAAERRRRTASTTAGRVDGESVGRTAGRLYAKANDVLRKRG